VIAATWRPYKEDARDAGISDAPGVYLFPIPSLGGRLVLEAGEVEPADGKTVRTWASARLVDYVSHSLPRQPAVRPKVHDESARARRLVAARRDLSDLGPLPERAPLASLDIRSRIEAHAVDLVVRAHALADNDSLNLLAEYAIAADLGDFSEARKSGLCPFDAEGEASDRAVAEQAKEAERLTAEAAKELARRNKRTPVTAKELGGVTFFVRRPVPEGCDPRLLDRIAENATGVHVANLPNGDALSACRMLGLAYPEGPLVSESCEVYLRVAGLGETFHLTEEERDVCKHAPIFAGPIHVWRSARQKNGPMRDEDFLSPGGQAFRAALLHSAEIIGAVAPQIANGTRGQLPLAEMLVRGLCLPPDVCAREISDACIEAGALPDHPLATYRGAMNSCIAASQGGHVERGELVFEDPGFISRTFEAFREPVKKYIAGKDFCTMDEAIVAMSAAGDDSPRGPRLYGRVTSILRDFGWHPTQVREVSGKRVRGFSPAKVSS
jgi:hypothetical protein